MAWVASERNFTPAAMLSELDALFARHLPASLAGALAHAEKRPAARGVIEAARELREQLIEGEFPANAAAVLGRIFSARKTTDDSPLAESAEAWTAMLR